MIISKHLKKENIIEYLLYMWHIEDLIRANEFDMDRIRQNIISRFELPPDVLQKMDTWYQNLIDQMALEEIQKFGHLNYLNNLLYQLNDFHLICINDLNDPEYRAIYYTAQPYIAELKSKSKPDAGEVEICLNALYMLMLLRMKKEQPSAETTNAIDTFGRMFSLLNRRYMSRK
jgi:hypothetical protein